VYKKKHYQQLENLSDLFNEPQLYLVSAYEEEIKLTKNVHSLPLWNVYKLWDTTP